MGKKRIQSKRKRAAMAIGIVFEPLEPRLLLSGSWGAVADGPPADSQENAASGFESDMISFSEGPEGVGPRTSSSSCRSRPRS